MDQAPQVPQDAPDPLRDPARGESLGAGFLRAALANSSDLLVVIDDAAQLTFVSAAAQRILGRRPEEWIGRNVFDLLHPDDAAAATESLVTSIDSGIGVKDPIEVRVLHADGSWREVEIVANNLLHDPDVAGILINARDVSERSESRRRLQHANRRFEQAFARSPIGMALTTLDGRFVRVNEALCELIGRSARELLTFNVMDVIHEADTEAWTRTASELLAGGSAGSSTEQRFRCVDGRTTWTRSTVAVLADDSDEPEHFLLQIEDIEERRRLLHQLRRSALIDPLTSLANRAGFAEHVGLLDPDMTIGVIAIDLDRFKRINDESGHSAGDAALLEVARRIDTQIRGQDLAARMGGDEFVIVCSDPDPDRLLALATRVVDRIAQSIDLPDGVRFVGASAGVSIGPAREAASLLNHADAASYRAKRAGGSAVIVSGATSDVT